MTAAQTSDRNYLIFKQYSRKEIDAKCFDCEKLTYYGKTCNGHCIKEAEQ